MEYVYEPGYSLFAAMQLALTMLAEDLDRLLQTKNIVGEVGFTLDIVRAEGLGAEVGRFYSHDF